MLSTEVEELLDELRRPILDKELREIVQLMEAGVEGEEMEALQELERRILLAQHMEGVIGYQTRQKICEVIAEVKHG